MATDAPMSWPDPRLYANASRTAANRSLHVPSIRPLAWMTRAPSRPIGVMRTSSPRVCRLLVAPGPAAQLVVAATRGPSDRVDPVPPAPHGMPDDAGDPRGDGQRDRPVSRHERQAESQSDDERPLEDLPPGRCLDFEDRERRLPDHGNREQDRQFELHPHLEPPCRV